MFLSPYRSDKTLHTGALNCDHSANSLEQCFCCYKGKDMFSGYGFGAWGSLLHSSRLLLLPVMNTALLTTGTIAVVEHVGD
jgi:hypothetical protein